MLCQQKVGYRGLVQNAITEVEGAGSLCQSTKPRAMPLSDKSRDLQSLSKSRQLGLHCLNVLTGLPEGLKGLSKFSASNGPCRITEILTWK
jgi:hypothetical protein